MLTGIYKITNKINGHAYIGQSIDIENRWVRHKWSAFHEGCCWEYPLYRAFRKYGIENFTFEVVELCNREELLIKEQYYIKLHNTFIDGYNQTSGGEGCYGQEKSVYQYNLNGKLIAIYPSAAEAARQVNTEVQNIYKACWKQVKTAVGFQWRNNPNDRPGKTTIGQGKRVYQYDLDGNYIADYPSLTNASQETGIDYSCLKRAASGIRKTAGGFIWKKERNE